MPSQGKKSTVRRTTARARLDWRRGVDMLADAVRVTLGSPKGPQSGLIGTSRFGAPAPSTKEAWNVAKESRARRPTLREHVERP